MATDREELQQRLERPAVNPEAASTSGVRPDEDQDTAIAGADSSPFETVPSGEKEAAAREIVQADEASR